MSFAEFELKRTLTDVLEDELYHLPSIPNNQPTNANTTATQHSTELIDMENTSLDSMTNTQSLIAGSDPLFSSSHSNYGIFSSYADPSLTTTMPTLSSTSPEPHSMGAPSPASSIESPTLQQKTVNLNNLIKNKPTSIPAAATNNNSTSPHNHNNLLDVKISHDNTLYSPIVDDNEYMLYYDDMYASKLVTMPLRDNNNALNMENAKVMFDQEFSDDDDDDEDDDKVFDDDHTINNHVQHNSGAGSRFAISNDYPVYYMDDIRAPASNELDSSAIIDDEDDDDEMKHTGLLNEDELYNIMIRDNSYRQSHKNNNNNNNNIFHNNNKRKLQNNHHHNNSLYSSNNAVETLVFNNDLLHLNRSKSLSLKQKPKLTLPQSNHLDTIIRKPLSNVNYNNNNSINGSQQNSNNNIRYNLDNDTTNKKKTTTTTATTQRSKFTTSSSNNPNEIFTCRLVNLITNEPCMAEFSRSYDLTRHQNTIHAKKKIVFRCSECIKSLGHDGYSKTFSRLDALTRHIKSKHEDLTPEQRQVVTKYAKENIGYVM